MVCASLVISLDFFYAKRLIIRALHALGWSNCGDLAMPIRVQYSNYNVTRAFWGRCEVTIATNYKYFVLQIGDFWARK
jgi:hypothetical protein